MENKNKIWVCLYTSEDGRHTNILFTSWDKQKAINEIHKYIKEYYDGEENNEIVIPVDYSEDYIKYEWHDAEWEICLIDVLR